MSRAAGGSQAPMLLLGLAEAALLAAMAWVPGARHTPLPALGLWTAAFVAYAAAASLQRRRPAPARLVWGVGIGARAALLPASPHFSEDLYRYMWDGWVQVHGVNPYLHAPAEPALAGLRTGWHALVNHPEVPTIYPPTAQAVFWLLALAGPSVLLFKLAWVACDLAVAGIVARLSGAGEGRGGHPGPAAPPALLLYLWCPLPIVEVAWSGHVEPLGLLAAMGAVLLLAEGGGVRARLAAGALLGLGAGVKLAPAAGLPALARCHGLAAAGAGLLALLLASLPYLGAGARALDGLASYAAHWSFDPGAWAALAWLLGSGTAARAAAAAAVITVAAVAAARAWPVERALFWTIGTALLLSPTLHPWYVLWILPFAALRSSRAWHLLAGLVFLSYWGRSAYLETGEWPLPVWLALLIHLPFLALLAAESPLARRLTGRLHRPREAPRP